MYLNILTTSTYTYEIKFFMDNFLLNRLQRWDSPVYALACMYRDLVYLMLTIRLLCFIYELALFLQCIKPFYFGNDTIIYDLKKKSNCSNICQRTPPSI